MLLTEQQLSRRKQILFPQPVRLKKVGKSMGAIRQVRMHTLCMVDGNVYVVKMLIFSFPCHLYRFWVNESANASNIASKPWKNPKIKWRRRNLNLN